MGCTSSKNDRDNIAIVQATDLVYCVKKIFIQLVLFKNHGFSDNLIMERIQNFSELLECSTFSIHKDNRFISETYKLKELLKVVVDDTRGKEILIKHVDYIKVKELMKDIK